MITEPLIYPQGLTVPELRKLLETWPDNNAETGEPNEVWFMTGDCLSSPVTSIYRLNRFDIVFGNDEESDIVRLNTESMAPIPAMWGDVTVMTISTDPAVGQPMDDPAYGPTGGRQLFYNIRIMPESILTEMEENKPPLDKGAME